MNRKILFSLLGALIAGLAAVVLTNSYITEQEKSIFSGMEPVQVLVVTQDLPAGVKIDRQMLAKGEIPKKYLHTNAVGIRDLNLVVGQSLNYPLKQGDPLLWSDLGDEMERQRSRGLAEIISPGERAVTIGVDRVSGVSGYLKSGDHVDILSTVRNPQTGEEATLTILQNLTILATGGQAQRGYNTVTLQATVEEAELLVFTATKGTLTVVLRNPEDIEIIKDIPRVNFGNILATQKELQKKRTRIEVIKQGQVTQ